MSESRVGSLKEICIKQMLPLYEVNQGFYQGRVILETRSFNGRNLEGVIPRELTEQLSKAQSYEKIKNKCFIKFYHRDKSSERTTFTLDQTIGDVKRVGTDLARRNKWIIDCMVNVMVRDGDKTDGFKDDKKLKEFYTEGDQVNLDIHFRCGNPFYKQSGYQTY